MWLNNGPCMIRPVELNYYPFMISLYKCSESCNTVDGLSKNIRSPSKWKNINNRKFNMITNKNELKAMEKHASYVTVNGNSIVQPTNQTKNAIMINATASVKQIVRAKKIIVWILAHIFVRVETI